MGHQVFYGTVGIVDVGGYRGHYFIQVVRRHVCGHTDRDTARAVREKKGKGAGKNLGFLHRVVVVRPEVYRLFLDVFDYGFGYFGKPALGIPHCRGRVAVHGAEVSLTLDNGIPQGKILGQTDKGVVDGLVTVRMVFTENVTDDTSALLERGIRTDTHLFH